MLQNNKDLDAQYNNYEMDKHYGFGISYEQNDATIKLNGGYFHKTDNKIIEDKLYYFLLSAKYEKNTYQILAELGTQKSKDTFTTKYAGYLQGLYRFTEKHIAVARVESYNYTKVKNDIDEDIIVLGYTYRPLYAIPIKAEYQFHSDSNLNQVLISLSVLF